MKPIKRKEVLGLVESIKSKNEETVVTFIDENHINLEIFGRVFMSGLFELLPMVNHTVELSNVTNYIRIRISLN